jgi:putative oxidoreductase
MAPVSPLPPPIEPPGAARRPSGVHRPVAGAPPVSAAPRPAVDARRDVVIRLLRWLLVALFLGASLTKLFGNPATVTLFAMVGAGQWFRYAVGSYELVGAALLVYPRTASIGATALIILMLGAVATEVLILDRFPLSSGATLVVLLVVVAGLRKQPGHR